MTHHWILIEVDHAIKLQGDPDISPRKWLLGELVLCQPTIFLQWEVTWESPQGT